MRQVFAAVATAVTLALVDCQLRPRDRSSPPAPAAAPIVIDSARPMTELVAAFQAGEPRVDTLAFASPRRDALVQDFMRALANADTARLARLLISRAEFAWLYFPHGTVAKPPYELDPALAWFQMRLENERSLGRLLRVLGGQRLAYHRHACDPTPQVEGPNRVWRDCTVTWSAPDGRQSTRRLFMSIIERDGRFKFFSYANRMD